MSKKKHKDCKWCEEKLFKCREHECPRLFLHKIIEKGNKKEIRIRGENISLRWANNKVLIFKLNKKNNSS